MLPAQVFLIPTCLTALITSVHSTQIPLRTETWSNQDIPSRPALNSSWDLTFTERPPTNTSYNLIFDSVASLLQRWPNTRHRNGMIFTFLSGVVGRIIASIGHTVVPGTIPPGTLLYHGTYSPNRPRGSEWVALDPEHSYLFTAYCDAWYSTDARGFQSRTQKMGNTTATDRDSCWHLTFTTTRPLRVLYFDGSSAAKLPHLMRNRKPKMHMDDTTQYKFPVVEKAGGPLDTQDILLWGDIREDMIPYDDQRLEEMCHKWGRGGSEIGNGEGFDGFVRMQMSL